MSADIQRLEALLAGDRALYRRLDAAAAELRLRKLLGARETKDCRQLEMKNFSVKLADWTRGEFDAYASSWGVDRAGDRVEKGAFSATIRENRGSVCLCWMHDIKSPVGVAAGLEEDDYGLKFRGQLARKTPHSEEVLELMRMGALKSFSIGYHVRDFRRQGELRILTDIDLAEISVVSAACNQGAMTA